MSTTKSTRFESFPRCLADRCDWCSHPLLSSFFRCQNCRLVLNSTANKKEYEGNYFLDEYKKQYGRSYFEDKKNIQKQMTWRLKHIVKYLSKNSGVILYQDMTPYKLLEIGSACGFFLELAQKVGFEVLGWEVSSLMGEHANQHGLTTQINDFESLYHDWKKSPFQVHVLVAFYVIEHFERPFLFWKAAAKILHSGGILALSVPSMFGPTFYFNKRDWISQHPSDHFFDYSPASLKKIGKAYSLELLNLYSEGIHPNRFPFGSLPFVRSFYQVFQKKVPFSDTVFAVFKKS